MNGSSTFYCVKCNRLEDSAHAGVLFRTGYFRVVHRLGCCIDCENRDAATAALLHHETPDLTAAARELSYHLTPSYRQDSPIPLLTR